MWLCWMPYHVSDAYDKVGTVIKLLLISIFDSLLVHWRMRQLTLDTSSPFGDMLLHFMTVLYMSLGNESPWRTLLCASYKKKKGTAESSVTRQSFQADEGWINTKADQDENQSFFPSLIQQWQWYNMLKSITENPSFSYGRSEEHMPSCVWPLCSFSSLAFEPVMSKYP